jgi:hypothetical protein
VRAVLFAAFLGAWVGAIVALISSYRLRGSSRTPTIFRAAIVGASIGLVFGFLDQLLFTGFAVDQLGRTLLTLGALVLVGIFAARVGNGLLASTSRIPIGPLAVTVDVILAVALASLLSGVVSAVLSIATIPVVDAIDQAWVSGTVVASVLHTVAILLVMVLLRWILVGPYAERWRNGRRVTAIAMFVCVVLLIEILLRFATAEFSSSFTTLFFNVTQVELTTNSPGRVFLYVGLPAVAIVVVFSLASRFASSG